MIKDAQKKGYAGRHAFEIVMMALVAVFAAHHFPHEVDN
jgi:hypothetical protein